MVAETAFGLIWFGGWFFFFSGCAGLNAHRTIAERVTPLGVNNRLMVSAWDNQVTVPHTFFSVV